LILDQAKDEQTQVNLHPKDPAVGQKPLWYSPNVLLEQDDAQLIKPGDTVTFINWGNLKIVDLQKENDIVTTIKAKLDLDNKDYKKTIKVTWLADVEQDKNITVKAHYYDYVINKAIIEKDDDWMKYVNKDSLVIFFPF
jgi:bifunctional glutamyl/prolyl-tRNA synthetase